VCEGRKNKVWPVHRDGSFGIPGPADQQRRDSDISEMEIGLNFMSAFSHALPDAEMSFLGL
jgi:hypothetical protein